MKRYHALLLVIVLLIASALAARQVWGSKSVVRLGSEDDSREVSLTAGQTLEIALAGNIATGYSWELGAAVEPVLRLQGEPEYVADSRLLGAGGVSTFRFAPDVPGTVTVQLLYRRPWEKDVAPAQTFAVQVTVTAR